jgi:hypothetical protein
MTALGAPGFSCSNVSSRRVRTIPLVGRPRACSQHFLSSGDSPLPRVGDHDPDNLDPSPAGAHGPLLGGREAVAHEDSQQLGLETVREQDRLGAAKGAAGEQPERSALFGASIATAHPSGFAAPTLDTRFRHSVFL